MDGENDTSKLFVNVLENVGTLIQEFVDRKIGNYKILYATVGFFYTSIST
jgi:hypothetical protein